MLSAVKCRRDARLAKTRLTHVDTDLVRVSETAVSSCEQKDDERFDDGTDLVRVSETAVSSCEQKDDERFDDGTDTELVKCTTARQHRGVWSHREYDCQRMPPVSVGFSWWQAWAPAG